MTIEVIESNENQRTIKANDRTVYLERRDPHGLWFFSWNVGEPPAQLSGAYTTVGMAVEQATNYFYNLATKKKPGPSKEV